MAVEKKITLAFLPSLGAGHIPSTLEFSKRLILHPAAAGRLTATLLLTPPAAAAAAASLSLLPSPSNNITVHHLPDIETPPLDATDGIEDFISLFFQNYIPHIKSALAATAASALFIDLFATAAIDVADELNIPSYIFFTANASMFALTFHLPILHHEISAEFEDLDGEVHIPGLPPFPPMSMPTPLMNKKNRCYTWFLYHAKRFKSVRGIAVNTFPALESRVLSAMASDRSIPPVYPVGPVLHLAPAAGGERHECLRWLDGQPPASVVFLCFGSMGRLTAVQAAELAAGIERSGYRFLWCLRIDGREGEGLPEGFGERMRGRGMVWVEWAPQTKVLEHVAVGGFVTHGGWNSCLESMWFGVPMLTWPLYAEQHMNAFVMAAEMGVATAVAVDRRRGGWVTAEEVERGVRGLMGESEEGRRVREKVSEMKAACRSAVEMGGSGWVALGGLVDELMKEGKKGSPEN